MYGKIMVGYDGRTGGRDALALARLVRAPDGVVIAAYVHPRSADDAGATPPDHEDRLEFRTTPGQSPAHGLHVLSEELEADLVVVGSSDQAGGGRVHAGRTAERLLNGSPCSVAVAPRGFEAEAGTPRVIGVAYDGSEESKAALREATAVALALDATVRLISAVPPIEHYWSAEPFAGAVASGEEIRRQRREAYRSELSATAQSLPAELRAAPILLAGRPADVIADEAEKGVHLLFMGSRSYGPIRRVMVGSTAIELMRLAPCPLIVIPRGAERPRAQTAPAETTAAA